MLLGSHIIPASHWKNFAIRSKNGLPHVPHMPFAQPFNCALLLRHLSDQWSGHQQVNVRIDINSSFEDQESQDHAFLHKPTLFVKKSQSWNIIDNHPQDKSKHKSFTISPNKNLKSENLQRRLNKSPQFWKIWRYRTKEQPLVFKDGATTATCSSLQFSRLPPRCLFSASRQETGRYQAPWGTFFEAAAIQHRQPRSGFSAAAVASS